MLSRARRPVPYRTALAEVLRTVGASAAGRPGAEVGFPRTSVAALGAAGLLGLTVAARCGGAGMDPADAAEVVSAVSRVCPATSAVLRSHYAAVAVIEAHGGAWIRAEIAAGRQLVSLALAEQEGGDLCVAHGTATHSGGVVALRARKRQVVAAGEADLYVWSSRSLAAPDGMTLWMVPAHAPDLFVPARPAGRGPLASVMSTVCADPVLVPADAMLGRDGDGLDTVRGTVLPWLLELS